MRGTRRKVLVIDDNELNRVILSEILGDEYEVLEASDGEEGLSVLSKNYQSLSIIILDVYMPVCNGFEFLERYSASPILSSVPVLVATGSDNPDDEVKCLRLGASDFVTKPYNPEVVLGRIHSIINLKESVATLSVVEYDKLTGLYTLPAFYHHAQELIFSNPDSDFDVSVCDIQDFKLMNSIFGVKKGDEILKYLAHSYDEIRSYSLVARHGDKFFCLYPSDRAPSDDTQRNWVHSLIDSAPVKNLKVKIGVYQRIDKEIPISMVCDRVMMAASGIKRDFSQNFAFYDDSIQKDLLAQQQMEADFEEALKDDDFVVWYQPKVDTCSERIVAAEALVRWFRKDGTMVSPGAFIPLFESDGLISRLDEYVFRKVCSFQKRRMEEGKSVVPVSINLSRNSLYQNDVIERYLGIVREFGLSFDLVPLELTESAATGDNEIISLVEQFCKEGFSIHMDDFGTGYSSLSSLAALPFNVVKLDKSLIDNIGNAKGEILIRYMVSIAREMGMETVAEGVETREQADFLKGVGCDMIQGYLFSPPKRQQLFEQMLDA